VSEDQEGEADQGKKDRPCCEILQVLNSEGGAACPEEDMQGYKYDYPYGNETRFLLRTTTVWGWNRRLVIEVLLISP